MNKPSMAALETELETLVDKHTLAEVLNCLESVCVLKGEHLRHNWQDETAAQAWEKVSRQINVAWARAHKYSL